MSSRKVSRRFRANTTSRSPSTPKLWLERAPSSAGGKVSRFPLEDLEALGYAVMLGHGPLLSFNATAEALGAMHRHAQYHELDLRESWNLRVRTSTSTKGVGE